MRKDNANARRLMRISFRDGYILYKFSFVYVCVCVCTRVAKTLNKSYKYRL